MSIRQAADVLPADPDHSHNAAQRAMWAMGDYHTFATATVWELGPVLVNACRSPRSPCRRRRARVDPSRRGGAPVR